MYPAVHVLAAATLNVAMFGEQRLLPSAAGALLPDAIDRTLKLAGVSASKHSVGHTPLAASVCAATVALTFGRRAGTALGIAYVSHLVADETHHGRVPWLLPFSAAKRRRRGEHHSPLFLLLELPALAALIWMARRGSAR